MWLPAITEKRISETDSTALWVLRDSLQEQQRQIAHTVSHVTTAVYQHTDQSVLQEAITRAQTNLSAASAKQSRDLIDLKENKSPLLLQLQLQTASRGCLPGHPADVLVSQLNAYTNLYACIRSNENVLRNCARKVRGCVVKGIIIRSSFWMPDVNQ